MAETNRTILDDFSDNGAKWSFQGGPNVTAAFSAVATKAGTAQGNTTATKTLKVVLTSTTGTNGNFQLTLPANVDISKSGYFCLDFMPDVGSSANITDLRFQPRNADNTNYNITVSYKNDGQWTYSRVPVTTITTIDKTAVAKVLVVCSITAGTTVTLYIDTVRACDYVASPDDHYYNGRNAGTPTTQTIINTASQIRTYLFGSAAGQSASAAGYQRDSSAANYGGLLGYNQHTGALTEVNLYNDSDTTFNTGLLISGLVQMYRMTADAGYLAQAQQLVYSYFNNWYSKLGNGSLGFMPYWVNYSGTRFNQTSIDQYIASLMGLLDFYLVTGRQDATVKQMVNDFYTWWNSANHTAYDGTNNANLGGKDPLIDAANAFVNTGDSTSVDTGLSSTLASSAYDVNNYGYRQGYLGTANTKFNQYSTLTFANNLWRCKLRRTKLTYPTTNAANIIKENILMEFGYGKYYQTDLPEPFNSNLPLGWNQPYYTWDGTNKRLNVTSQPQQDASDFSAVQWISYIAPLLIQNGGDINGLIAAGSTTSETALTVVEALLKFAAKNQVSLPGTVADKAIPRSNYGPYLVYNNLITSSFGNRWGTLIDEQPDTLWFAGYAWWYLYTQFTGLWPSSAFDRVLNWQYLPYIPQLKLTVNGTVGDIFTVKLSGMQNGQTYTIKNLTTGAVTNSVAGVNPYSLAVTLANAEETITITANSQTTSFHKGTYKRRRF